MCGHNGDCAALGRVLVKRLAVMSAQAPAAAETRTSPNVAQGATSGHETSSEQVSASCSFGQSCFPKGINQGALSLAGTAIYEDDVVKAGTTFDPESARKG